MKIFLIILIIAGAFFGDIAFSQWTEDARRIEAQQVALWKEKLKEARTLQPEMRTAQLWLGLRNMGYRTSSKGHSSDVQKIYQEILEEISSIPGHARYFADEIKRKQREVEHLPTSTGPRVSYDYRRTLYFHTMSYLPSPETIAVLGEFLSDDKDTPVPLHSPGSDWGPNPRANSHYAADTINKIGLRNPPFQAKPDALYPEELVPITRAWWEKVKAGEIPFSFVGQPVEYRFQPDGSLIETLIEIPEEERNEVATKVPGEPAQEPAQEPAKEQDTTSSEEPSSWLWIAIAAVLSGSLLAWIRMRVFRK